MSSYVVDKDTINTIVGALKNSVRFEGNWQTVYPDLRYIDDFIQNFSRKDGKVMALALVKMNEDAARGTYDDFNCEPFEYQSREFSMPADMQGKVQIYKTMRCYLYQVSESRTMDTQLYRSLTKYAFKFAHNIVESLPEWELAEWR